MFNFNSSLNKNFSGTQNEFKDPFREEETKHKDVVRVFLVSFLVFIVVVTIATYIYTVYLSNQLLSKKNRLDQLNNSRNLKIFEENIDKMRMISKKINLINSVYENRYFISSMLFPLLENTVESDKDSYVYFNKFTFKKGSSQNISSVLLSGIALDLPTLARQVDRFKNSTLSKYFLNFKLTSVNLNDNGNVNFDMSFDIDISTKAYMKIFTDLNLASSSSAVNDISGVLFNKNNNISEDVSSTTKDEKVKNKDKDADTDIDKDDGDDIKTNTKTNTKTNNKKDKDVKGDNKDKEDSDFIDLNDF